MPWSCRRPMSTSPCCAGRPLPARRRSWKAARTPMRRPQADAARRAEMVQGVAYEATGDQRRLVRGMAAVGVPQEDIATLLEIDAKTLRKHFRRELDCGAIEATTKVAQSLYQMAT